MNSGSLPDARDFRAVVGDDAVSISPPIRATSPTVSDGSDLRVESNTLRDITRTIQGESYRLNAESFFQANDDLVPQLIDAAIGEAGGQTALELYSGVGLFTLPLARRFAHVIGVEGDAAATKFARESLVSAGLTNAEVATRDVGVWLDDVRQHDLSRLSETSATALQNQVDFLLLDPPRVGVESRVIAGVLGLRPQKIAYVSCDPATLARDLKKLIAGGYRLEAIAAFDMFPQTHHVETVVHLIIDQG
jgi:23S rRNA (uracil1939-C5)-methyltransferase